MLAIVCPGQGSQTPGFLTPWLELPGLKDQLQALSEQAGVDLITHGTTSDEETIKDTAVAQPLIVAAGLLAATALKLDQLPADAPVIYAGHSVGEITAAALTGVLEPEAAMRFVRTRATGMADASNATPTGMSAVLGGDAEDVLAAIAAAELTPANVNGGGQIVAAGALDKLAAFAENPPAKTRVIPLKVAGAFHTDYMASAQPALAELAQQLSPQDPQATLLSNFDGQPVSSGTAVVESLVAQVARPVRWDACMETLLENSVNGILELTPAGTLVGLAKRGMRGVKGFALKTPDDLSAAQEFIAEHTAAH
ncbi:ACP S-malonyltransferase [Micrococcoides hystricis]|uniref:[acyl-carrier-protein] S-malonyltransferase n=1 Tax=Micrococcoides hystricis TaxID=1572761 RepID=A0ABV6PC62_9MICC